MSFCALDIADGGCCARLATEVSASVSAAAVNNKSFMVPLGSPCDQNPAPIAHPSQGDAAWQTLRVV